MIQDTILVVDDEPPIVEVIRQRLTRDGYAVRIAGDGAGALASIREQQPDLMILDLMLPDTDGFDVLRVLRQGGLEFPVIVLTARDDQVDVIVGLELGADDYMVKPFNPRELVARVRAVLRRSEARAAAGTTPDTGRESAADTQVLPSDPSRSVPAQGLHLDMRGRRAWLNGRLLDLRAREYDLLYFLAQRSGQVLSRTTLLDHVWGMGEYIDERTVDVHVHRLRRKLADIDPEAEPIQTERGIGYRFEL